VCVCVCVCVQQHRAEGHRTLIFSQSKKMLDLIEVVLQAEVM